MILHDKTVLVSSCLHLYDQMYRCTEKIYVVYIQIFIKNFESKVFWKKTTTLYPDLKISDLFYTIYHLNTATATNGLQ